MRKRTTHCVAMRRVPPRTRAEKHHSTHDVCRGCFWVYIIIKVRSPGMEYRHNRSK